MYSSEFIDFLDRHPCVAHKFRGVFAIDQIPDMLDNLEYIIVNTE